MGEFTKGPWTHEAHDEDGFFRFFDIVTEARRTLGTIDDEDDARLMAAAPDLLAACKTALEACRVNLTYARFKDEHVLLKAFYVCDEAIKKARGEA